MASKKTSHVFLALVIDLVLVVLFTVVGHYTHAHSLDLEGIVSTAWPFVTALVAAWILAAVWDRPLSPLKTGTAVWAITVLLGMVIRAVTGEGTAGAFIVVAASLNLLTLVGWRVIASATTRRGSRR
ncbi:DUF3054 domain-containing protein [Brevibacterium samyangense]|uniref:DUF3054 domain-containing protein n=1 Tax=Brevibacterium samyangense TaxID=366888 RepID=UPI0031CEBDC2